MLVGVGVVAAAAAPSWGQVGGMGATGRVAAWAACAAGAYASLVMLTPNMGSDRIEDAVGRNGCWWGGSGLRSNPMARVDPAGFARLALAAIAPRDCLGARTSSTVDAR